MDADSQYVCPRCGRPAEGASICRGCGLDLDARADLPTRRQYEAGVEIPAEPRRRRRIGRRERPDAELRYVRRLSLALLAVAAAGMAASAVVAGYGLLSLLAGLALAGACVAFVWGALELMVRVVPERYVPLALAATLLPVLGAAGAAGLPETLIHFTERESEWAFEVGREVSLIVLGSVAVIAGVVAWGYRNASPAIVAVVALAVGLSAVGRDLIVRELDPSWCIADEATIHPDGSISTWGSYDGCTLLLPEKDPFE